MATGMKTAHTCITNAEKIIAEFADRLTDEGRMSDTDKSWDYCPSCGEPVQPERTHNGICYVYHFVHCGWGHDGGSPHLTLEEATEQGKAYVLARLAELEGK